MYFAFLHFYNSSTLILSILGLGPALWSYLDEADNPLVVVYCVVIMMVSQNKTTQVNPKGGAAAAAAAAVASKNTQAQRMNANVILSH